MSPYQNLGEYNSATVDASFSVKNMAEIKFVTLNMVWHDPIGLPGVDTFKLKAIAVVEAAIRSRITEMIKT